MGGVLPHVLRTLPNILGLPDLRSTKIGLKWLGKNQRATLFCVVFQKRHIEARESSTGSVESMAEEVLSFCIPVAEIHAPCLIVTEVRTTGNFKVSPLSWSPDFNIVCA